MFVFLYVIVVFSTGWTCPLITGKLVVVIFHMFRKLQRSKLFLNCQRLATRWWLWLPNGDPTEHRNWRPLTLEEVRELPTKFANAAAPWFSQVEFRKNLCLWQKRWEIASVDCCCCGCGCGCCCWWWCWCGLNSWFRALFFETHLLADWKNIQLLSPAFWWFILTKWCYLGVDSPYMSGVLLYLRGLMAISLKFWWRLKIQYFYVYTLIISSLCVHNPHVFSTLTDYTPFSWGVWEHGGNGYTTEKMKKNTWSNGKVLSQWSVLDLRHWRWQQGLMECKFMVLMDICSHSCLWDKICLDF